MWRGRKKARHTVFFLCFVAPKGWKVGSLKRRVRSHLNKNCMPLTTTKTTTTTTATTTTTITRTATTTTLQIPLHMNYFTMHCTTFIILHSGTLHYRERVLGLDFAFWKKRSFAVTCGQLQVTQIIVSGRLNTPVRQLCPVKRASTPLFLWKINVVGMSIAAS